MSDHEAAEKKIPLSDTQAGSVVFDDTGDTDDTDDTVSIDDTYALGDAFETVYDRPDTHGEPEDSFARIAGMWRAYLMGKEPEELDAVDVSNMMSLLKIARSAEGHYHSDNWVDLAGYAENSARLAEDLWADEGGDD